MIRLPPISTRTDTLFPNTTLFRSPRIVEAVATPGGATLDLRVEDPPPAKWPRPAMLDLLREVVEDGTGRNARLPVPAYGQTGTTQDSRDAWFVGFAAEIGRAWCSERGCQDE